MKSIAVVLALVLVGLTEQTTFWGNRKVNCGVSVWSNWSVWSAPAPAGTRTRSRTVVRSPRNGGSACPSLTEEEGRTDPWNRAELPKKFHNKFMTGHTHYYNFVSRSPRTGGGGNGGNRGVAGVAGAGGGANGLTLLPRDLLFIIDMSGSINRNDWTLTKQKLAALIEKLCGSIGQGRTNNRIAIVTFSTRVVLNFDFKTHWTVDSVRRAIMNMPQDRKGTCTGDAFVYAHKYMFEPNTGIRSATESVKEVLVLTDGHSNCGAELAANVQRLQVKAFVFALAIGNYDARGKTEIESMVSRPLLDHIFSVVNFVKFAQMVDIILTYPDKCAPFELS